MKYTATIHPSEEILAGCALDSVDEEIRDHLAECSQCSEFVEDMRTICQEIADLDEQQIPLYLHEKILAIANQRKNSKIVTVIQNWYRNPFFYGIMTVLFAVFAYVIFFIFL
jgi:predicted anti-sigma-YlaC factor YlaD